MSDSNLQRRRGMALLCLLLLYLASYTAAAAPPVVSNVRAAQRSGTGYVDITYDLSDPDNSSLSVTVAVSTDAGATWSYPSASLAGKVGSGVSPGAGKQVAWNAGSDLPAKLFANVRVQVTAGDAVAPSGMALIPAGNFTMGNCMDPSEGSRDELPLHTVYVSAFYMDKYLVTKSLWDTVYQWAIAHGYTFDHAGSGTASTYPVQRIDWYDCVKWCNARSEKEGRTPAYYTDAGLGVGYRTGQVTPYVRWSSGYRLPTEAEWEKAARGRASGHRFPWSDADTITHSRANYFSSHSYSYDVSPTRLYHPAFSTGTSPVGYFAANGYGLYDMAGNVWQWCWDWHGSYSSGSQSDPRGPPSGPYRVRRGGSLGCYAIGCRAANRYEYGPTYGVDHGLDGFRSVLPPGQAGSSTATSPIFAVDTRAVSTGTLTGLVQGNGTPVVNAQVRIDGTPFTASTDANGRFTLANVPAGSGYLLKVSAAGFAPKQVPGVTVTSGTTDKGTIQLATLNGPCRIIPLQPDVNPVLTQIEDGGVAYRYYKVVAADGKTPAVSANIELRMVAGGTVIPQTGDVSDYWPGKVAGMPDADGILRLRIPASSMLLLNSAWSFQVLESGVVQQTFQAQAVPRQYDQVWKHKVGVGIGGKLGVAAPLAVKGEGRQAYSTEIRQTIAGGQVGEERIKRTRDVELRAGLEVESPGIVLLGGGAKASAGAGVLGGGELSSEYNFNSPTTDDSYENALKVYLTLGDDFSCAGNPLTFGLYDGLRTAVEPYFLGDKLMSAEGEARLGVYGDASAQLGWKLGKTAGVGLAAEFSAETYAMAGVEQTYQPSSETVLSLGCGASVSASAQAGVFFSKKSPKKGFDLSGLSLFIGADGESRCKLHFPNGNRFATQVELEQSVGVSPLGVQLNFGPYQIADTSLYSEYTQDLSLDLPSAAAYQRLLSESPHWNAAAQGGAGLTLKPDLQANLMEDLLNLANETLNSATYDLSVYMADKIDADVGGDLLHVSIPGIGTLGLSGDVAFSVERGIEAVEEHGRLWQITKRLPLESYPKLTASQLPSETIVDKERRWVATHHCSYGRFSNRQSAPSPTRPIILSKQGRRTSARL